MAGFDPPFVASGSSHRGGSVPDPGSTAGTTHYLREDATWDVPPGTALSVGDGTTTVDPTTSILFSGATVTDAGGGLADVAIIPVITNALAKLSTNPTVADDAAWHTIVTMRPAAGVYVLTATLAWQAGAAQTIYGRIFDGSTVWGACVATPTAALQAGSEPLLGGPVTLDGSTALTLDMWVESGTANATALGNTGTPATAGLTQLQAFRVA